MASSFRIKGLCAASCTPMTDNGELDLDILPKYIQHFLDFGVPNAFVLGTGGEGLCLSLSDRKRFAEAWIKAAKGKLSASVIHIGAGNLVDSIELAKHAEEIGADAIACVGTHYYRPTQIEMYVEYMRQVAAAAPNTPFMLYDLDFYTFIKFNGFEFMDAAKDRIPTLCGLKHTSVDFVSMCNILSHHGDRFQVLMGTNDMFLQGLVLGIESTICNTHYGIILNKIIEAFNKGDLKTARKEQDRAIEVKRILDKHFDSLPGGIKTMLRMFGLEAGQPRLPMTPVLDATLEALRDDLTKIGYFEWGVPQK